MLIKTRIDNVPLIQALLTEKHPYEVPELVVYPIVGGLPSYLEWLHENSVPSSGEEGSGTTP